VEDRVVREGGRYHRAVVKLRRRWELQILKHQTGHRRWGGTRTVCKLAKKYICFSFLQLLLATHSHSLRRVSSESGFRGNSFDCILHRSLLTLFQFCDCIIALSPDLVDLLKLPWSADEMEISHVLRVESSVDHLAKERRGALSALPSTRFCLDLVLSKTRYRLQLLHHGTP